jgi:signal peptidase I
VEVVQRSRWLGEPTVLSHLFPAPQRPVRPTARGRLPCCHARVGWELRLEIAGPLQESQVCRTQDEVLDTSEQWKAAMSRRALAAALSRPDCPERMKTLAVAISWVIGGCLAAWVAIDASRRRRTWVAWAISTLFFGVLGLIPWFIVRRRTPIVDPVGFKRGLAIGLAVIPLMLLMVVISTYVKTFLFQVARIEGHAMSPTLADRDRLIVNKLAYQIGEPQIGDIVMLYYPLQPDKSFVKRLVATEGDHVRIVKGKVYRNDVAMDDSFVPSAFRSHDDWGPQIIPEGYYFVMGDYRNNSSDSRHWGFVPWRYVIGKVQLRYWPPSSARVF